jgi:hypothetical protein
MTVLDICGELTRALKFSPSFVAMLRDCDAAAQKRITRHYLEFIFRENEAQPEPAETLLKSP